MPIVMDDGGKNLPKPGGKIEGQLSLAPDQQTKIRALHAPVCYEATFTGKDGKTQKSKKFIVYCVNDGKIVPLVGPITLLRAMQDAWGFTGKTTPFWSLADGCFMNIKRVGSGANDTRYSAGVAEANVIEESKKAKIDELARKALEHGTREEGGQIPASQVPVQPQQTSQTPPSFML